MRHSADSDSIHAPHPHPKPEGYFLLTEESKITDANRDARRLSFPLTPAIPRLTRLRMCDGAGGRRLEDVRK